MSDETGIATEPEPPAPRGTDHDGRKLFAIGLVAIALLLGYYGFTADVAEAAHLQQGLTIFFLATLPSLLWARRGGSRIPAFEVLMLTTANAYALPLLNGHTQLQSYSSDVITTSANLVLLYQAIAIATFELLHIHPRKTPLFTREILTRDLQKYVSYGLVLSTAYVVVSIYFSGLIPSELNSVLRAVLTGVGLVTTFSQARLWGQGLLPRRDRTLLIVAVAAQTMAYFSTLFLVAGMSIAVVAMIGFVSGARRLPVAAMLTLFAIMAVLHNGKSAMRSRYWNEATGLRRTPELQQLPSFYFEWVEASFSNTGDEHEAEMTKKLFDRTSLFHILCLVTFVTPEQQPFLAGETYGYIPSQLIPRFFWPDKPQAHVATSALSIYYGLQSEETVKNATIGFGMIAEAYANFGFFGVGLLAFALGAFYKWITGAALDSPLLSYPGLFLIILTAWSFQAESTMAIWLSSMFQACVGVLGLPFIIRNFIG